jgi:hypothetical protein
LFAFDTDLSIKSELDRYLERDSQGWTQPLINSICVLGKGLWFHRLSLSEQVWQHAPPTQNRDEVVDFLCVLANGVPEWVDLSPRVVAGQYFIKGRPFEFQYSDGRKQTFNADGSIAR